MKGNKKLNSIFENCHETASQEAFLRSCGFARRGGVPPDSDPSVGVSPPLNDGVSPHRASDDSETDSIIGDGEDLVESHAIRFVSPPESADTVDLEEVAADRTVPVEDEESGSISLEKSGNLLFSDRRSSSSGKPRDERMESPAKKLKIPLRDVVKAIVMNSRNAEEEDREVEKISYVQMLVKKGFKFPGGTQTPSGN
ncbi:uncharacterized protein LOC18992185 [Eutrema salsugineum]|uniref:uncharacterized protein LOC18992185 n=1 Tax=Eutrema salsugineum TaxID=72664 RepID=UPI000CED36A1|nr:uncharacterized protein LOC18992185 [Eutrema salsugineum]